MVCVGIDVAKDKHVVGVQLHKPTAYHLGGLIVPSNVQQLTVGSAGVHQQVYDLVDNVLVIRAEPEQNLMPRLPHAAVCRHTCGIPHKAAVPAPGVLPLPAPA